MSTTTNSNQNKPSDRKRLEPPSRAFRTATGNGSRILEGIDGRCSVARRYAEIAGAIAADLGGHDELTELEHHLVRSVAGMVVLRERLDAKVINGESVNTATYCRLSNAARRIAATLGLERRPKDVTPTLSEYIKARGAAA